MPPPCGPWHRIEGPLIPRRTALGAAIWASDCEQPSTGCTRRRFGVYAVLVAHVLDWSPCGMYHGASSLGVQPMFGENTANLETFLLISKVHLYGADPVQSLWSSSCAARKSSPTTLRR